MAIRIGIVGSGWRTGCFLNILNALPDQFSFTGMLFRDSEKAAQFNTQYPDKGYTDKEQFYSLPHDFIIVAVPREVVIEVCQEVAAYGVPILCETPPCDGEEELSKMWDVSQKSGMKIQVSEQYFLQPYHVALQRMIDEGLLGAVSNLTLSMIHDYHGMSILRKLLGVGYSPCTITAETFTFPVVYTCGKDGMDTCGRLVQAEQKRATFRFEGNRVAFFDFCGEQYFNHLRARHLQLQGDRGEVHDQTVCYLDPANRPVHTSLVRQNLGEFSNLEGYGLRGLTLGGILYYKNPFPLARLNDDELSIAALWKKMGDYLSGGLAPYPLREALQDTYLALCMDKAIKTGLPVTTKPQPWHPKQA